MYPTDLKYTDTHEWVRIEEKTGTVTVGISEYAVKQLSDIVFLELPSVGDKLKKGSPFGAIESVKAVFDLSSPVTGEVIEVNQALTDNLDLLQTDPYGQGWMVKIKAENQDEFQTLMKAADYGDFLKKEEGGP